jgi:hypothetical protein
MISMRNANSFSSDCSAKESSISRALDVNDNMRLIHPAQPTRLQPAGAWTKGRIAKAGRGNRSASEEKFA